MQTEYIYVVSTVDATLNLCKIGRTSEPESRLSKIQTGCPYPLRLAATFAVDDAGKAERFCHAALDHCRMAGEWFGVAEKRALEVASEAAGIYVATDCLNATQGA